MCWWHRNIIGIIINHRNFWYAHLPPAQCSTIASNNHYAGSYMENYPKGSEGESLGNIWLLDREELRLVVICSSDWHTKCSGPNFDPPSLSTHEKLLDLLNYFMTTHFTLVHGYISMMPSAPILRSPEFSLTKCCDQSHLWVARSLWHFKIELTPEHIASTA